MESGGIEPLTFYVQNRCSPNWATTPHILFIFTFGTLLMNEYIFMNFSFISSTFSNFHFTVWAYAHNYFILSYLLRLPFLLLSLLLFNWQTPNCSNTSFAHKGQNFTPPMLINLSCLTSILPCTLHLNTDTNLSLFLYFWW